MVSRLPRFKRSSAVAPIRLTSRDQEILKQVHRHRFLRSDHIVGLIAGSPQQIRRRLQRLFHHGYLERPRCQLDYYQSGSRRMAYGIGNKGAAWVKRKSALPYLALRWKPKNRVGRLFLEHALLISDIMVAVEIACRQRQDVRLLSADDLHIPKMREPFQWSVEIQHGLKSRVIPDRVFGMEFAGKQCWYFLEADRATMPVTRRGLDQSSFYRKILAYTATWQQRIHRNFGIDRFRVLTVTTNSDRTQTMLQACRDLKNGRGLFLFSDRGSLQNHLQDFFAAGWRSSLLTDDTLLSD